MPTVLTRDEIQGLDDRQIEWVEVPEWGSDDEGKAKGVFVRSLSGAARDSFEMAMIEMKRNAKGKIIEQELNLQNLRAKLVVRSAVDSADPVTAKPVFTTEDVTWLGEKNAAALQRIYKVAQRLSGLSDEDAEELTMTLGNDQSGDSGSDSPPISDTHPSLLLSRPSAPESSANGKSSTSESPSAIGV